MTKKLAVKKREDSFTESTCNCDFCVSTHKAVKEWDSFIPKTHLQYRMREAVSRIEGNLLLDNLARKQIKN